MRSQVCQHCFETFNHNAAFRSLFLKNRHTIKCGDCQSEHHLGHFNRLRYWIVFCIAFIPSIIIFFSPFLMLTLSVLWLPTTVPAAILAVLFIASFFLSYLLGARVHRFLLNLWNWHYGYLTLGTTSVAPESFG